MRLKQWARANDLLDEEAIILGIPWDNPEITKPDACRYDTCLVLSEAMEVTGEVSKGKIMGGRYCVVSIDHTAEAVQQAWMCIHAEIVNQGHRIDENRPIIERYTAPMVRDHRCELCVPTR